MLHWLHVNCTRFLTHLAWHGSRGREAMDEIGIWPRFAGRGMHDRLVSYDAYDCAHSICGAHLVRDCAGVAEQEHQEWATEMQDFLLDLHDACHEWRLLHLTAVPAIERDDWVARYFEILAAGYAAQPPPPAPSAGKRKGRHKQSKAKNLLDALLLRAEQVLALLDDLRIPFTNNQAERDLRMMKVQQKVSGCFRSPAGADYFARIRSYVATMRKQAQPILFALEQVFGRHGLRIYDVEELATHGGSLRIFASHSSRANLEDSAALQNARRKEGAAGLPDLGTYLRFAERVEQCRRSLLEFFAAAKRERKTVAAYGAAAKGNTLLNFCGATREDIPMVADRNPHKQAKFLPGTHIPVVSPEELMRARPDYVLILPWNLQEEIRRQLHGIAAWGGRFVTPVPLVRIDS